MRKFRELINHNKNGIGGPGLWMTFDEIHSNNFPRGGWDWQWLKQSGVAGTVGLGKNAN